MKKFAQHILLIIVAVTVFLTGAGVTIMNYCCTSCSGQTLFMTQQHICCADDHSSFEQENLPSCCTSKNTEDIQSDTCNESEYKNNPHCTASRVSVDIDAASFRPQVSVPFVWISDTSHALVQSLQAENIFSSDIFTRFIPPPDIPPREYLSLIRVLLI